MFHNVLTSTSMSPKLSLLSRFSYFRSIWIFFLPYINRWKNLFQIFLAFPNTTTINLNTRGPQCLQGTRRESASIWQQTVHDMRQRSRKAVSSRNSPVSRGLRLLFVWKNVCPRATGNLSLWSWITKLFCPVLSDKPWYDMIWYDIIWYDMIWYMIWYDLTWHDMTWHDMTWHDMIWYDMIWYMIWYDMMRYDKIFIYCNWVSTLWQWSVKWYKNCK
jgi:hypothetical protein